MSEKNRLGKLINAIPMFTHDAKGDEAVYRLYNRLKKTGYFETMSQAIKSTTKKPSK